ncbi:uncharacterized protein EV420DRAFT_1488774 [Desarmillaria tabescens]|uniref:Uncharacterized protein n=1 Tax=Armillaria tabescens TaxID=1929756 RepID=A0AA39J142_ARMTA|nr:uncharacterized protein EV420DRAFT_1488774 [Desarmillaria tabescens]KAK0434153.1 hypothetical protein EV420DRAFT_1488774 [Desarmillaria tabescens]
MWLLSYQPTTAGQNGVSGSCRGVTLIVILCILVFDESLCIPGDPDYSPNGEHCMSEYNLRPYCIEDIIVPPVWPSATPSPSKTALPADLSPKVTKPPHPVMIKRPQPLKELSFANYRASNKVEKASKPAVPALVPSSKLPAPTIRFSFLACTPYTQYSAKGTSFYISSCGTQEGSPSPKKPVVTAKKPVIPDNNLFVPLLILSADDFLFLAPPIVSYEDEEMEGDEAEEEGAVEEELIEEDSSLTPPLSPDVPPPPHAYHPLTGEPLNGLSFISSSIVPSAPVPPLPPAAPSEKAKGKQKAAVPPSPSPPPQPAKRGCGRPPSSKNKKGRGASSMQKSIRGHLKASIVTGHPHAKAASEALSYEAPSPNSQDKIPEEEMEPVPEDEEEAMQQGDSVPHVMADVMHAWRFTSAVTEPIASGSGVPEEEISLSVHSVMVDNTMYACAFHPSVDLQFHEPLSRQALEHLKLLALPPALASLFKPSTKMRNGHPAVFHAHSDLGAHILCMPNIFHPCFNCSFSGFPELCKFTGEIGEEACTKCKTGRHGKSICEHLDHVTVLDAKIGTFYNLAHSHMAKHNKVVQELVDGLDSIALREGGTAIIDAYAEVSNLIHSFIIEVGKDASDSGSEGGADDA